MLDKGSRNKLGETFITALAEDFELHGAEAIAACREKAPHKYHSVVASLLPKEMSLEIAHDLKVEVREFVQSFEGPFIGPESERKPKNQKLSCSNTTVWPGNPW